MHSNSNSAIARALRITVGVGVEVDTGAVQPLGSHVPEAHER